MMKRAVSLILVATSSSLLAMHPRLELIRDKLSELEVEFAQDGVSMGRVVYSGCGAVVLRERLEFSRQRKRKDLLVSLSLLDGLRTLGFKPKYTKTDYCFGSKIIEVTDLRCKKLDLLLALHGFDRSVPGRLMEMIVDYAFEFPLENLSTFFVPEIIDAGFMHVYIFSISFLLSLISFFAEYFIIYEATRENHGLNNKLDYIFCWHISDFNFSRLFCPITIILAQAHLINWALRRCYRYFNGDSEYENLKPSCRFLCMYWLYNGLDRYEGTNMSIRAVEG